MKLKAAIADSTPSELVDALNGLGQEVFNEVVAPHLHRPDFGPAEFYLQHSDVGDGSRGLFCEVRLSGVSRTEDRSEEDFKNALKRLRDIYVDAIVSYLPKGQPLQLMVTIMVDTPPMLYETEAEWVEGENDS